MAACILVDAYGVAQEMLAEVDVVAHAAIVVGVMCATDVIVEVVVVVVIVTVVVEVVV